MGRIPALRSLTDCPRLDSLRGFATSAIIWGLNPAKLGRTCREGHAIKMTGNEIREKSWSGNDIREAFLRFFEGKGHRRVRSPPLVPHGGATPPFSNAGGDQIKKIFLRLPKHEYT